MDSSLFLRIAMVGASLISGDRDKPIETLHVVKEHCYDHYLHSRLNLGLIPKNGRPKVHLRTSTEALDYLIHKIKLFESLELLLRPFVTA